MPKHAQIKEYLGDSVYATFDEGGMIVLTTENGMPADPSNVIYLEREVYAALVAFVDRIRLKAVADALAATHETPTSVDIERKE